MTSAGTGRNASWLAALGERVRRADAAIWDPARDHGGPGRRLFRRALQVLRMTVTRYVEHDGPLRVASLTNKTFLSLVPLLATLFVILKSLGVQETIGEALIGHVTAGSEDAARAITEYIRKTVDFINKTNVGGLAWLGGAGLFVVSVAMLRTVEQAMNVIWEAPKARSFSRMTADYISLIIVTPVLLAAGAYVATVLKRPHDGMPFAGLIENVILWPALTVMPWVTSCAVYVLIYAFMPNVRVRWTSAVIGGVAGGSAWHAAQSIYIHYSIAWFGNKYNAIYESFAWIFILMLWVSISWTILLVGAELAAAHQHLDRHRRRHRPWRGTPEEQETLGLRLAALLVGRMTGPLTGPAKAVGVAAASDLLLVPEEPVEQLMRRFESVGLVARIQTKDRPDGFLMCRSPGDVSVLDVLRLARHGSLEPSPAPPFEERVLFEAERDFSAWLAGRKLSSLAEGDPLEVRTFVLRTGPSTPSGGEG